MRTRKQKDYRRGWFRRIDWEAVGLNGLLVIAIAFTVFALIWVALRPNNKTDSADSVPDTVAVVESSPEETKSYTTEFDTTVATTQVVIKTNRRVKISVR